MSGIFKHTELFINQLSKETGIPIGTLRFYEKSGLFSGKRKEGVTSNNYVYYDEEVIEKIRFIEMAKAVGFTLVEIKEVVDRWFKKQITQQAQIDVLDRRLIQIDEKIQELKAMKQQIQLCKKNIKNRTS